MHLQTTSSKQVCCCGADCWTKVLAWLQTITSTIASASLAAAMITMAVLGKKKIEEVMADENVPPPYRHAEFGVLLGVAGGIFFVTLLHLVMGVVLLKGANERRCNYLTAWIVYSLTLLIVQVALKVVAMQRSNAIANLLGICLTIAVNGFLIWVVHTFRREVQGDVHVNQTKDFDYGYGFQAQKC